jgi:hypothetical protein
VVIQEILFERHNLCFELERFLDPATGELIEAKVPAEYLGSEFGPVLRSYVVTNFVASDASHRKIKNMLASIGIDISTSQINNILLNNASLFDGELAELRERALNKETWQHIDDTSWRVLGSEISFTIVTGNSFFTQFATVKSKARAWAVYALSGKKTPVYLLNDFSLNYALADKAQLSLREKLTPLKSTVPMSREEAELLLSSVELTSVQQRDLLTGMHLAAFKAGHLGMTGAGLMSDDAGQFSWIYEEHALCWVHELRHYKLIEAHLDENRFALDRFLSEAWDFYFTLKDVRHRLTPELREWIVREFNRLFRDEVTEFKKLDQQKKLTHKKMDKLLAPVWNAKLPMHNNAAERDIRGKVIKRRVSYFNRSWRGAEAWDKWMGLRESCRKLGVNFYQKVLAEFSKCPGPRLYELLPVST